MSAVLADNKPTTARRLGQALRTSVNFLGRALAVTALTAVAPGAPLLLTPMWQRLRGDKDFFHNQETFPPPVVQAYGVTPQHPLYGAMKRDLDRDLQRAKQPPPQLLVLDPIYEVPNATYVRSRTVAFKEEFLALFAPSERKTMGQHEAGHLVTEETAQRNRAYELAHNAKAICRDFGLAAAAIVGVAAKVAEYVTPQQFHLVADTLMRHSPLLPVTPANMLLNAAINIAVALPVTKLAYHHLARRAEFAADRYVIDHPEGGVDKLTHTLLRASNLPDRARQVAVPMREILTKPKLDWHYAKELLSERRLFSEHPTVPERIRAAYAYAAKKGITPKLGINDTWRAADVPRL